MSSIGKKSLLLVASLLVVLLVGCSKGESGNALQPSTDGNTTPQATIVPSGASTSGSSDSGPSDIAPSSSTAQPTSSPSQKPIPTANQAALGTVTALRLADFQSGWAGGEGWIARTDNGGKSWTKQLQHKYIVNQLFALNDREAWATLDSGDSKSLKLLQTEDGGKKWTDAGTVPNRSFLHFVSSEEAFSGNARTTDGGRTWTKLNVPSGLAGDAYFHDRNNGWAVTRAKDEFNILRTTDGGRTWRPSMKRATVAQINQAVIRSAGKNDAWVELVGESGMSQTSYSLFHTADGGKTWTPVIANNQAGSGPAPGYAMDEETKVARNNGNSPGALYVVNPQIAFMGGQCMACDLANTMGKTTDGGKTWTNLPAEFAGFGQQLLAAADADHVWWINTDSTAPSVMYASSDGGKHWNKVHTFAKPK